MLSYMISPKLSMSSALRQKIRSPVGDTTLSFNFFYLTFCNHLYISIILQVSQVSFIQNQYIQKANDINREMTFTLF